MASSRIEFPKLWISSHRSSGLVFCLNSDSLGLLTLKADGRRRVYGCRPGRCLGGVGVSVVSHKCFGGFGGVSVVSQWYLGGVRAVSGDVLVVSWWRPWCLGGVSVVSQRLPCWFKVFTVSWLYLGGVVLVVLARLCWWSVGCAMHQVVFNGCMLLSWRRRQWRRRRRRRRRWWWRWWWWRRRQRWWWWWCWWPWRWRQRRRWRWRQQRRWRCDDDLAFAGLSWSGGRDGCWRMLWSNLRTNYDASTEATAGIPSVHAATRAVGCSPHPRSWHACCMLHLHRDPRANLSKEKGIRIENQ